jgi:phage N-6-adenine-methyltransferase
VTTTWHKRKVQPSLVEKPEGWTSDQWATPWEFVRKLEQQFGAFDLDPCAEPHTAKAPRFYTIAQDGLTQPWFGSVFVNPPYSSPGPWCVRANQVTLEAAADLVVMLLPAAVDTRWFHHSVLPFAEVQFIQGRIRFLGWEGTPIPSPKAPSLLAIYRTHPFVSALRRGPLRGLRRFGNGAPGPSTSEHR